MRGHPRYASCRWQAQRVQPPPVVENACSTTTRYSNATVSSDGGTRRVAPRTPLQCNMLRRFPKQCAGTSENANLKHRGRTLHVDGHARVGELGHARVDAAAHALVRRQRHVDSLTHWQVYTQRARERDARRRALRRASHTVHADGVLKERGTCQCTVGGPAHCAQCIGSNRSE